jgi:hypothetical protein
MTTLRHNIMIISPDECHPHQAIPDECTIHQEGTTKAHVTNRLIAVGPDAVRPGMTE